MIAPELTHADCRSLLRRALLWRLDRAVAPAHDGVDLASMEGSNGQFTKIRPRVRSLSGRRPTRRGHDAAGRVHFARLRAVPQYAADR
jgi:hypothetical protein